MEKELLIVFVKNLRLGKVKTRLAASIGDQKALKIYERLLIHTVAVTQDLPCDKLVCYTDFIPANDLWAKAGFKQALQIGNDLGEKMSNAFRSSFIKGYERAVLIGSDCYDLRTEHLTQAFEKLQTAEAVIGPAEDGGYYLIGLTESLPALFRDKKWSTDSVCKETITDFERLGIRYESIEKLSDLDDLKDLMRYEDLFVLT